MSRSPLTTAPDPTDTDHSLIVRQFFALVDLLTRRGFLAGSAALALSACGTDEPEPTARSSAATRVVDTSQGAVRVPADPRRVVCLDYFTAIFLMELGLTAVGGIDYSFVDRATMYPAYVKSLKAIPSIGRITATNSEKVAQLHPDLILGPTPGSRYDNSKGAMARLADVAPVASVDFGQGGDWRDPFAQTAAIVNRTARLDTVKQGYEERVRTLRADRGPLLDRLVVSVVDFAQDGQVALALPRSGNGVVLRDLGLTYGRASRDNGTNTRMLSFERVGDLADSDLILFRADAHGRPANGLDAVVELAGWKQLPAVRLGHVYPMGWADLCTYRWGELAIGEVGEALDDYSKGAGSATESATSRG